MMFLVHSHHITSAHRKNTARTASIENGISFQIVDDFTGIIPSTLVTQSIRSILAVFDPMILPSVISLFPRILARRLTVSSGSEVPNATTVKPITRLETPKRFAIEAEPETRKSAPLIRMMRPTMTRTRESIMKNYNKSEICLCSFEGKSIDARIESVRQPTIIPRETMMSK